ncbi:response regulator [Lentibacillus jeotgali]|uniref:response regulator n=1 Tax=Lentibacillus jeotgali TaxID=558169 RepID=UPI0002628F8D|nr:response regulator [Lentibacillus jeotgali]
MINVLIVEDDPMVAKFNRIYIEEVPGFRTIGVVHDISTGWHFLNDNTVDLILLDIYMANSNGLDWLAEIRNAGINVDVIAITAANDRTSIQRALSYGAFDYLIKPFDFERFKDALMKYREKFERMKNEQDVRQEDLDAFLLNKNLSALSAPDLPKGLTAPTFSRIARQIVNWEGCPFSTAEIADKTGISRVSISKYLKYLVGQDVLKVDVAYQETGRPLHYYMLRPERIHMIYAFMAEEKK